MTDESTVPSGYKRHCPTHHWMHRSQDCERCQVALRRQDDEARAIGYAMLGLTPEQARILSESDDDG